MLLVCVSCKEVSCLTAASGLSKVLHQLASFVDKLRAGEMMRFWTVIHDATSILIGCDDLPRDVQRSSNEMLEAVGSVRRSCVSMANTLRTVETTSLPDYARALPVLAHVGLDLCQHPEAVVEREFLCRATPWHVYVPARDASASNRSTQPHVVDPAANGSDGKKSKPPTGDPVA